MSSRVTASIGVYAERSDAVTRTSQPGDRAVDNCGYLGGHTSAICGLPVGTRSVVPSCPRIVGLSSTPCPQGKTAPDLRSRRFSTQSTGAKNPMEYLVSSENEKVCSGQTWGKLRFRTCSTAPGSGLSGCPSEQHTAGDATRPNRHVKPGWHTSHLSVAGSAWHTADTGGTQR
jgi:hypothetical protein